MVSISHNIILDWLYRIGYYIIPLSKIIIIYYTNKYAYMYMYTQIWHCVHTHDKDEGFPFYGPDNDSDSKRGFTIVSAGTDTMNVIILILQLQRYMMHAFFPVNGACT